MKNKLPVLVFSLIITAACNSNNNQQSIRALSKSLEQANMSITESNQMLLASLEEKTKDLETQALASIWAPKALVIKNKAIVTVEYLEEVKNQIRRLKEDDIKGAERILDAAGNKLYDKVLTFGRDVIQALDTLSIADNPAWLAQLNNDKKLFEKEIGLRFRTLKDSASHQPATASDWLERNLDNTTPILATAMLNKLQNDVLATENTLLKYCDNNSVLSILHHETIKPLITMNRSSVKSGQSIEVSAGLALYKNTGNVHITIDGKPAKADEHGVTTWNFNAKTKPGKYRAVVAIEHLWPDGRPDTIIRNLVYTVVN